MAEENKAPWELDWGIEEPTMPLEAPESPVEASEPWNLDWGITEWLKAAPKAVNRFARNITFKTVTARMWDAESGSRHTDDSGKLITSPRGARGITQIMPAVGKKPGYGVRPLKDDSEEEYLRFGEEYVQAMLDKYEGDWRKAVAAYNAGPGNVDKAIAMASKEGGDFTEYLPKPQETIPYMNKILGTEDGKKG